MIIIDLCSLYQSLCKFFAKDNSGSCELQVSGFEFRVSGFEFFVSEPEHSACKLLLRGFELRTRNLKLET